MSFEDIDTGQLIDVLRQDIKAYSEHFTPGTVLLSGGFDSRCLLALLHEMNSFPEAVIISHHDELFNADGIFAEKVADRLGTVSTQVNPGRDFFSSAAYLDYLIMNEVSTPSLYLFIAQAINSVPPPVQAAWNAPQTDFAWRRAAGCIPSTVQAVWEGVAPGNALKVSHQPEGGYDAFFAENCFFRDAHIWQTAFHLFDHSYAENMYTAFHNCLEAEKARYSQNTFGTFEFMVRNRMRNRTTINPLQVYANTVLPFTPGLSKPFWNLIGSIPYELKAGSRLYLTIFERYFPKFHKIPFLSGGNLYFQQSHGRNRWLARAMQWSKHPGIQDGQLRLRRLLTGSWGYWKESQFIPKVISQVNPAHPDLHQATVELLQQTPTSQNEPMKYPMQHLLFYWQVWRWIMSGELTVMDKHIVME